MSRIIRSTEITLHDLKRRFALHRIENEEFFPEWQADLPEITESDRDILDRIKAGYFNLIEYPPMLEETVKMAVLGPLLNLAGFYLPPFHVKSEVSVRFSDIEEGIIIEGKIDVLVFKEKLWVMVIESKQAVFSLEAGFAQILSYMLTNPNNESPCYGLITNGGSFIFIKLVRNAEAAQYATSRVFELRNPGNELYSVLKVMKRIGQEL